MKHYRHGHRARDLRSLGLATVLALGLHAAQAQQGAPALEAMPESKPGNPAMVELGRHLFFEHRISGDWGTSCATCHQPDKGWGDGKALSTGYRNIEYFRNAPTVLNAGHKKRFLWDGRLDGSDPATLVRDMITEVHTMNMDSRLLQERLKQIPEYEALWKKWRSDDPNGMRVYGAIAEFIKSLQTTNAPFDRFIKGEAGAIGQAAREGYALFTGKAGCVSCHNGPLGSDGKLHRTAVPEHPEVLSNPLRTMTMLRHYATSGMPNYMNARTDVGSYAITKDQRDLGKFLTPQLRDLRYTAPYMHNGVFGSLAEVVSFYNAGGGPGSELKPLNLTPDEQRNLVAFLFTLSGEQITMRAPPVFPMKLRPEGRH